MVKVAGLWELGWNTPLAEAWLWQFVLRDFEVHDWFMSPVSGIKVTEPGLTLVEYPSIVDTLDANPEQRVFVDEAGEISLPNFEHPEDVIYVFGSAGTSPMRQRLVRESDLTVSIPTIQNAGVLWPHQCLLIVLYDRLIKSWQ